MVHRIAYSTTAPTAWKRLRPVLAPCRHHRLQKARNQ